MWAPVSPNVYSKTLKHKVKFCQKFTDNSKRTFFINRFCDEYTTAAAMDPSFP
jgi:hypothetical protein